jgi:tetratricopeptide (TPR) repeat protein
MHLFISLRPAERRILFLFLILLAIVAALLLGRLATSGLSPSHSRAEPGLASLGRGNSIPGATARTTADNITQLRAALADNPDNADLYAQLGLALLQQVRETADPSLYDQAETAFNEALGRDPNQLDALVGQGMLALSRHDFQAALQWGEQAKAIFPYRYDIFGVLVDAHVELGNYSAAINNAQEMVNLRPGLASYTRVSYIRELHGDTAGAITAMQEAVAAGTPQTEATAWTQYQLGNLYFNSGDWQQAAESYQQALQYRADYPYALAGLARIEAANGRYEAAIARYQEIVQRLPLPEFVIALGELYELTGQPTQAEEQYQLVQAIQQLNAAAGMDVDLELALFDIDHGGDPAQALEKARLAYGRRPSVHAADVLAWALYKNGAYEEAQQYSQEALRLGTRDALFHFHAAKIASALGNELQATEHMATAQSINPAFSLYLTKE